MRQTLLRVMLADDHPIVLEGLQNRLANVPNLSIVGQARSFADLEQQLRTIAADVVILDLVGMGPAPIAFVAHLQRTYPDVRVIVFSSRVDLAPELLEAGARGYVTKEELWHDLLDAIHTVMAGQRFRSIQVQTYLDQTARTISLTTQEMVVLKLLAQGLGPAEIAGELTIGIKSVHNYLWTLRTKTGCANQVQLVDWYRLAYGDRPEPT
ncbi:MAG: response regulator transcription factor [Chloroflexia bacterium]|nr:response regulator transcription factor [Chloroflexia bacterium]